MGVLYRFKEIATAVISKMVEIIPRWDLYSRVAKLEESMFTKEDAKVMEARMTTRMDAPEARMTARMDIQYALTYWLFGVSTSLTAINTFGLIKKKE